MARETPHTPEIQNRKARFDYHIEETFEAGIVLRGTEVKSLRAGEANLTDAYAEVRDGEVWLLNLYIKAYQFGSFFNHDERRARKLLLKKRQIEEIEKGVERKGYTVVPLKLYFKDGFAKVLIGMAKGKKSFDKRDSIREKDERREMDRKIKGAARIKL